MSRRSPRSGTSIILRNAAQTLSRKTNRSSGGDAINSLHDRDAIFSPEIVRPPCIFTKPREKWFSSDICVPRMYLRASVLVLLRSIDVSGDRGRHRGVALRALRYALSTEYIPVGAWHYLKIDQQQFETGRRWSSTTSTQRRRIALAYGPARAFGFSASVSRENFPTGVASGYPDHLTCVPFFRARRPRYVRTLNYDSIERQWYRTRVIYRGNAVVGRSRRDVGQQCTQLVEARGELR